MVINVKNQGTTLAELLIVVILMSIVIFGVYGINYFSQIYKANDLKRKEALSRVQKVLEDFHTDHSRYPTVAELTYETMPDTNMAGKICGSRLTSPALNSYIGELPCDPKSPDQDYVYFVFDNYQKFAIFTNLENEDDSKIKEQKCEYGCSYFVYENNPTGSISNNRYNYYVSSSNFVIETCYGKTDYWACYPDYTDPNERCKICTDFNCQPGYTRINCQANWCLSSCGN